MEHFMGVITKHDSDDFFASFSLVDNIVSILPHNDSARETCRRLQYNDLSDDNDSWMYGYSGNHTIAFLRRGTVPPTVSRLGTINFYTPIIVKETKSSNNENGKDKFKIIEFVGGIIDILYPPQMAFKQEKNMYILKDINDFTKSFTVNVNGESFVLKFSINVRVNQEIGQIPDFNDTHSTISFIFEKEKEFSEIEKYYSYALKLCQFCCGRINVGFDINLHNGRTSYITVFKDQFNDYANENLYITEVINLNELCDDVIKLFKIIIECKTQPYLLFLPKSNEEYRFINYTNVTDMCISIDREYRLLGLTVDADYETIEKILNDIPNYLKESNEYDDESINRVKGLLGNLKNPSSKMMITQLYKEFYNCVERITNTGIEDELRSIKLYSIEEFSKKAAKFVDIRNKAAHKGVVWNDGIDIFHHLKLLIYLSVLKRASISKEKSTRMLNRLFYRYFM